jgi:hypothetical protein
MRCLVLRKRRGTMGKIYRLAAKLLLKCRSIERSALIPRQAPSLRQKPFAIGKRDG